MISLIIFFLISRAQRDHLLRDISFATTSCPQQLPAEASTAPASGTTTNQERDYSRSLALSASSWTWTKDPLINSQML